jgi:hypothetical protein
LAHGAAPLPSQRRAAAHNGRSMTTLRALLREATPGREEVDRWLDPAAPKWAQFDAELGYRPHDCLVRDGVDGALTVYRYEASGARRRVAYAEAPCRINTYGNSFTQCHQVSDGETWQEYLAAHLGEPLRNFGVGGYGVYQAYRRLVREEQTAAGASHVVLNIWRDDHVRSLYAWMWLHSTTWRGVLAEGALGARVSMFHATPWAHLRLDPDTGAFAERENPYPTPESLYRLCDPDHVYERFRGDVDVQLAAAQRGAPDVDRALLRRVADALGEPAPAEAFAAAEATAATARRLLQACGLRASAYVVERARAFAAAHGKRLLLLLSYLESDITAAVRGAPRFDEAFVRVLAQTGVPVVDSLQMHVEDYAAYRCSPGEYAARLFVGHYNPRGNHFFAFAIKDAVVAWLEPKPPAYDRQAGAPLRRLAGTLA